MPTAKTRRTTTSATPRRRPSGPDVAVRRREFWDPLADRVSGHEEVVCCTSEEKSALLAARPEASRWWWLDFGDRHVAISPFRAARPVTSENAPEIAKASLARRDQVEARRLAQA
jgi:hypothetical protein